MKKLVFMITLILLASVLTGLPVYADGGAGSNGGNEMSNYTVETGGGDIGDGAPGDVPDPNDRVVNPGAEQESQSGESGAGDIGGTGSQPGQSGADNTDGGGSAPQLQSSASWADKLIYYARIALYWLQYTLWPWLKLNKLYVAIGVGALLLLWMISSIVRGARRRRRRRERQLMRDRERSSNA